MGSTKRTRGFWIPEAPDGSTRGPNGRRYCKNCAAYKNEFNEVPAGRETFCSKECWEYYAIRNDSGYVRDSVWHRDHGICARCNLDTQALRELLHDTKSEVYKCLTSKLNPKDGPFGKTVLNRLGFAGGHYSCHWWEADHIVPVVEGGGECDLDNYRTLCLPCHKTVTRELRRRRALERNPAGPTARTEQRRRLQIPLPLDGAA